MSFFDDVGYYAEKASAALGIPASVILAQWNLESAGGTSPLAQRANNLGGIKYSKNSIAEGKSGAYAKYGSLEQFTQDYIRVMSLPYYKEVREAVGIEDTIQALANSPYAENGYGGGDSLLRIIEKNKLDVPEYKISNPKFEYNDVTGGDKENIIGSVFGKSGEQWAEENPAVLEEVREGIQGIGDFFQTWILIILVGLIGAFALFKSVSSTVNEGGKTQNA